MRILQVDTVDIRTTDIEPKQAIVIVQGTASTPGWSDIHLAPLSDKVPADGILELELVGTPPTELVPSVLAPVSAHFVLTDGVERLVGVTVMAKINSQTRLLLEPGLSNAHTLTRSAVAMPRVAAAPMGAGVAGGLPGIGQTTAVNMEEIVTTLALFEEQKPVFGETDPRVEGGKPTVGEVQSFFENRSPFGSR